MNYPKYSSIYTRATSKCSFSQGRQRYKCKGCYYTVEHRYGTGISAIRRQALGFYLVPDRKLYFKFTNMMLQRILETNILQISSVVAFYSCCLLLKIKIGKIFV